MTDVKDAKPRDGIALRIEDPQTSNNALKLVRRVSNAARKNFLGKDAPVTPSEALATDHPHLPRFLIEGVQMSKVSAKKRSQRIVKLLPEQGQVAWQSNSLKSALMSDSGWAILNLEAIIELRFGEEASSYRQQFNITAQEEPRWMTIIYLVKDGNERRVKMLHLIAAHQDVADAWKQTLQIMVKERKALMAGDMTDGADRWKTWLQDCWQTTDGDRDQKVSFPEVIALCGRLGVLAEDKQLKANFQAVDVENKGYLTLEGFQTFVQKLQHRKEIATLFDKITGLDNASSINLKQFTTFLKDQQKSRLSDADISLLFTKYAVTDPQGSMSLQEFTRFLSSSDNAPLPVTRHQVTQDMTRPLCEYFISSSHNTYLLGNQLSGDSSAEGYIRALQQGCRCVELDVWNGDTEPIVYHGRTLTSKITLKAVLQAIAKYAFVSSPYPVILSVEVHCSTEQQNLMAQLFKDVFGSALVDTFLLEDEKREALPSPEQLKGRILIKAKNLLEVTKAAAVQPRLVAVNTESASETSTTTAESSDGDLKRKFGSVMNRFKVNSPPRASGTSRVEATPTKEEKAPMSAALAGLIVYTVGVKCRGFNKKEVYHPYHVLSLGERRLNKTLIEAKSDLVDHNRTHLVRSYPGGFRFSSSNYLPQTCWAVGVQLVALNWQTYDLGTEINTAFFQSNGKCGYILKPEFLRKKNPQAKDKDILNNPTKYCLNISVLSGQQLIKNKTVPSKKDASESASISPYVEVALFAPSCDPSKEVRRVTGHVKGNGFNPVFPNSTFDLPFQVTASMLDLVFISLSVYDANGDNETPFSRCCVSLGQMQPGYRHLPLQDALGQEYLFSSLFIHSQVSEIPKAP